MKQIRISGLFGIVFTALWFLLVVMTNPARASSDATLVPITELAPHIEMRLAENGLSPDTQIVFDAPELLVRADTRFHTATYNNHSGRFVLRAAAPDGSAVLVSGYTMTSLAVPVLVSDMPRDYIITETDLVWIDLPFKRTSGYALDADQLVGMSLRRPFKAGAPVRLTDLRAPTLVKRGALVTMVVEAPGLRLTHQGIARKAGAKGDIIEIENARSSQTIKAVVIGEGLARAVAGAPHTRSLNRYASHSRS